MRLQRLYAGLKRWVRFVRYMVWPPDLAFAPHAERRFLRWFAEYINGKVRSGMWLSLGLMLLTLFGGGPMRDLRNLCFGESPSLWFEVLRSGVMLPCGVLMLVVTYSPLYTRYYLRAAGVVAPILVFACLGLHMLMLSRGVVFSSWMVLVSIAVYEPFSLPHRQALWTTHLFLLAYAASTMGGDAYDIQHRVDFFVVCVAVALVGSGHYMLQKSMRRRYIDSRRLADSAQRDSLTGLFNRRMFDEHMRRIWQQAARSGLPTTLMMIDVDAFKLLNDSLGHQAGDRYLVQLAEVLARTARRPMDIVTRYGGEEFAVALWNADCQVAQDIAQQVRQRVIDLQLPHPTSPVAATLTVSIGMACIQPRRDQSYQSAILLADEALYAAKRQGRNCVVTYDSSQPDAASQ